MKKNIFIWIIAAILVVVAIGTTKSFEAKTKIAGPTPSVTAIPTASAEVSAKTPAPDFSLKDLSGKTIKLSELKGKKVYINFWATWCGYCDQEMPDIEKIHNEFKDQNLIILAIDVAESDYIVKKYIDEKDLNFTVLLDKDGKISTNLYKVSGYPTSVFINSDGTISNTIEGMMTFEGMKSEIVKLK